jgi:hypothetical protein
MGAVAPRSTDNMAREIPRSQFPAGDTAQFQSLDFPHGYGIVCVRFLGNVKSLFPDPYPFPWGLAAKAFNPKRDTFRSRLLSCQRVDCSTISSQLALAVLYLVAFVLVWGSNAREIACYRATTGFI